MREERAGAGGGSAAAASPDAPPAVDPVACANCGAPLEGPYCHRCGQRARSPVGPLRDVAAALFGGFLDLDRRILRTLRALLLRPGLLSEEWVRGRRERWVDPFRLYLSCSVAYFVTAALSATPAVLFVHLESGEGTAEFVEWLPRLMFVVVPAFALLLAGLFRRSRRWWVEHLVFALHLHAAWYLLLIVEAAVRPLLPETGSPEPWSPLRILLTGLLIAVQVAVWVYLWAALRRFYGRGRLSTLGRMVLLMIGYGFLLAGATMAILFVIRG